MATHSIRDGNAHSKPVGDIKWSSKGDYLGSVSFDKSFKVGQLDNNGNYRTVYNNAPGIVPSLLSWQGDAANSAAVAGDDRMIEVFDIRIPRPASRWMSLGSNINMAWSGDGNYLSLGNKSDHLLILDARTGKQLKKQKFNYEINELVWSSSSDYLLVATGGMDSGGFDILHFTSEELKLVESLAAHTSSCYCLKSCGNLLVTGSADMLVAIWDIESLAVTNTISSLDSAVRCLSVRGDGEGVAIACESPSITIHSTSTGQLLTSVDLRFPLMALSYHPSANILAVAPDDRSASNDESKYLKLVHFSEKT